MDALPSGAIVNGIGITALLVLVFWMFTTDRLYTKGQVDAMRTSHRDEIARMERAHEREVEDVKHERGEWRTQTRLTDQVAVELNEQNRAMLNAFGPTLTDFLESLRAVAQRRAGEEPGGET